MNKKNITLLVIVLLIWNVILTVLLFNNKETPQTVTEENVYGISTDLTKVAQDCYSSVVAVKSINGKQTGFIYKQDKETVYIVTTYHGIGSDNAVSVTFANNKTIPATVVGYDYKTDVAVLSLESPYVSNIVKCGDNEYTNSGEFIICIGSGTDAVSTNDVKLGIISNGLINISDTITYNKENFNIQKEMLGLSLDVNEGFSGSPILNMKKEVIGMIQMSDDDRTYALTINEVKLIADSIINNQQNDKLYLGVKGKYIKNMEDYERNMLDISFDITNGYYVEEVLKDSLATDFNILNSDIIISINNSQINSQKDLLNALYSNNSEDLTISVYRDGETIDLKGTMND